MNKTTIVIVDDHPVVRLGVRAILSTVPDFELVGEAATLDDARYFAEQISPHIFICGQVDPRESSEVSLRDLLTRSKVSRAVVFSRSSSLIDIMRSLREGASGFVQQSCAPEELIEAVWVAANGGRYLGEGIASKALSNEPQENLDIKSMEA